jgi:hypothetical protein
VSVAVVIVAVIMVERLLACAVHGRVGSGSWRLASWRVVAGVVAGVTGTG